MPSAAATRRASSTASLPQHAPAGAGSPDACHTRMVMPTTSCPASTRRAAATEEPPPPLMPTTTRSSRMRSVSRAEQSREPLQLLGVRVADLDPALPFAADDPHPRHERMLQRLLKRPQLSGAPPLLRTPRAIGDRRAHRILRRAH